MATNEVAVLSEVEKGTVTDTRRSPLVEPPHAPPDTAHMGELWQRYQDATAAYKVAERLAQLSEKLLQINQT
ncbi:MAG: hypothetical protein WCI05_14860 [Myxococcales bacterium]